MSEAGWTRGRLRGKGGPEVIFGFQHEDGSVEADALLRSGGGRAFCVCSGGEVAFSLLEAGATAVTAADVNPAQMHLVELKRAFIRAAQVELMDTDAREAALAFPLPQETEVFWSTRRKILRHGLCFSGIVERRTRMLGPVLRWFAKHPGSRSWNFGWKFLSLAVTAGYATGFTRQLPVGWSERMKSRVEALLKADGGSPWWTAEQGLGFGEGGLNLYKPSSVKKWRNALDRLQLQITDCSAFLEDRDHADWSVIALSNVMDTMCGVERIKLFTAAAERLKRGGRLVVRSMVFPPEFLPDLDGMEWEPLPPDRSPICPVWGIAKKME